MRRLLHLDQRTAGSGHLAELGVHDVAQVEDQLPVVRVVFVPQHAGERRRADRAEFHRLVGQPLRDLPQRGVFQRPARQLLLHDAGLIRLLHFPQDLAGPQAVPAHPAARRVAMAVDAAEALDRIEEPGFAADREIEPAVAVGDDVQPGGFLRVDHRGDGVEVLFAEQRIAQRRLERSAVQAEVEPQRPRIGAGDRRRQHHVLRDCQHSRHPLPDPPPLRGRGECCVNRTSAPCAPPRRPSSRGTPR